MQKLMGLIRRCVEDYNMIDEGDKIAVGVSGGKDSLVLLMLLAGLRGYYRNSFQLEAITVDMGLGMDYSGIARFCQTLDVPYTIVKTEIAPILFDYRHEKNPCSMCSKMRRGALNQAILERGFHKLALGHHYDDAVETFLMSLIYEGRISCFQPVTNLDRTGIIQIRPMLYLHEKTVEHFARQQALPVLQNRCPVDRRTKREEIKELLFDLVKAYPDLKERIFGAMQRLPLPEWEPRGHRPRKREESPGSGYILDLRKTVGHRPLLQVGASVILEDAQGRVLLQKRTDNHCWGYPGGSAELDERVEDAAARELREETGLTANKLELFGVFSGRELHYVYPNGDEVSNVDIVFLCRDYSGEIRCQDGETQEVGFFEPGKLPENLSPPIVLPLRSWEKKKLGLE